ncbi:CinA family protein [Nocardioides pelophilus]|uniref:CinA family protein n=1 Tax=Nocardioides pelophilus TaxID=2172019 RepID=UPI001601C3F6|nr:CinA family protein [Nocardioides pelophilus]
MSEATSIVDRLEELDATLATAESITGGRLAARVTDVPGSSAVFAGGVVSYATAVKVAVLGVPDSLVAEHGVISAECARSMAEGVRALLRTTYALSTTGVAGPDTQEGEPVGTVFIGVAGPEGTEVVRLALDGDRGAIQAATVDGALSALRAMIDA